MQDKQDNQLSRQLSMRPQDLHVGMLILALLGILIIWLWQGDNTLAYITGLLALEHPESIGWAVLIVVVCQLFIFIMVRRAGLKLPATREMVMLHTSIRRDSFIHIPGLSLTSAVGEEILFRAALLGIIAAWIGDIAAGLIIGILFAALHIPQYRGNWVVIGYVFIIGLMLNGLFLWYGDLWGPLILHFLNNALNFLWMRLGYIQLDAPAEDAVVPSES